MSEKMSKITKQIIDAIIKRIAGVKDLKSILDYLMKPEYLETSSRLSETQVQAIAEMDWLGENFPSMKPLQNLGHTIARWSISEKGKGRDDAINLIMASEHRKLLGSLDIAIPASSSVEEGKGKSKKE